MAYITIEKLNAARPINSRLTALEVLGSRRSKNGRLGYWIKVSCSCNSKVREIRASNITRVLSCGCLIIERNLLPLPLKYKKIEDLLLRKPIDSLLTPIAFIKRKNDLGQKKVKCKCKCGKITTIRISSFVNGKCRSCGCLSTLVKKQKKYVGSIDKIYRVYRSMLNRCLLKTDRSYKNYGGNGVTVCNEWRNDYQKFLDWALLNGWNIGLQLDKDIKYREKYPDAKTGKIYSPEFCQFITRQENNGTTSKTRYYLYEGEYKTCKQISEMTGLDPQVVYRRLSIGRDLVNIKK